MAEAVQIPPRSGRAGGSRYGVAAEHEHYKWWALSCTSLGMLLAATNSGTLIIALPDLERSLHTSLLALVWVILAYLIAATVLVLMAGRLSDLFGRKRAYVGGFLLFALASLGAGFSPDGTVLILWRVLQGIGSAFLFANAAALVTDAIERFTETGIQLKRQPVRPKWHPLHRLQGRNFPDIWKNFLDEAYWNVELKE